jgi:hypothetical protein
MADAKIERGAAFGAAGAAAAARRAARLAQRVSLAKKRMQPKHPKREMPDAETKPEWSEA